MIKYLIVLILALPFAFAAMGDGACDLIAGTTACGASISSAYGQGAIEICGDCYVCGAADNVCPEDFTDGAITTNCGYCPDPDCITLLTGTVTDTNGLPLPSVEITAQLLHIPNWQSLYTTTSLADGTYSMNVPSGSYKVAAKKFGFETRLADYPKGNPTPSIDFVLADGSCHADCTGYHYPDENPRCNAACEGFTTTGGDTCQFQSGSPSWDPSTTYDASEYCDGVVLGTKRVVASNNGNSFVVDCCRGSFIEEKRPQIALGQSTIENLVTRTLVKELEGEAGVVKVKIIIYTK